MSPIAGRSKSRAKWSGHGQKGTPDHAPVSPNSYPDSRSVRGRSARDERDGSRCDQHDRCRPDAVAKPCTDGSAHEGNDTQWSEWSSWNDRELGASSWHPGLGVAISSLHRDEGVRRKSERNQPIVGQLRVGPVLTVFGREGRSQLERSGQRAAARRRLCPIALRRLEPGRRLLATQCVLVITMTIRSDFLPTIDLDAVQAAIYAWPYSPLRGCLQAASIPVTPVEKLIELDPSIETMVTFWLLDRQEPEGI